MQKSASISNRRSPLRKLNRWGYAFILPFVAFFVIFNLYPIFYSLWLSFFQWNGLGQKVYLGLANYKRLFTTDPYFFKSIGNTFIILLGYLPLTLLLAIPLASLLHSKAVRRWSGFFQTAQFLPYIISAVSVGMLFMLLFDWSTGMVNQLLIKAGILEEGLNWLGNPGLARMVLIILIIWKQLGYILTLFLAGMTSISPELYEAAEVDGANAMQRLLHITIPMLRHIILFVVVTSTIDCLQIFDAPRTLFNSGMTKSAIGGPGRSCLTAVWYLVDMSFGLSTGMPEMGYGAAISYGLFIVIAIFSFINYRVMNRGGDD